MRITAASIIVLVCALAAVGLLVNRAAADGHGCPSDWPTQQSAAPSAGQGSIDYNDFHTDGDGDRWFVIRSTDSNGYTTIRAYVADDGYDSGYRSSSPDETCYLIVRRPSDAEDAAQPIQISFQREQERENLPFVDELFASLTASEIDCIRNVIGKDQTLQRARLMDTSNTLKVYNCIASSKMYDDATITFLVKLFAIQDGGRSYKTVNCLIDVSTEYEKLVHLRLGTASLAPAELETYAPGIGRMGGCLELDEHIRNLLNIVVAQDKRDKVSTGAYIAREIRASTNSALQSCISRDVGSKLDDISGKTVIESFAYFPNGELLQCLLLDQETAANVYAHVASSRAGISTGGKLSPNAESCFKEMATSGNESTYRLLVALAVNPEGVVDHSASFTADDAVLKRLSDQGFACMTPTGPNDPRFQDWLTAFNSSNLALRPS